MNKVIVTGADAFKIKPNAKYLLVFKSPMKDTRDLTQLDQALKNFFDGKVLALFADEFTEMKMYELMEDKSGGLE